MCEGYAARIENVGLMNIEESTSAIMPPREVTRLNWALAVLAWPSAALMRFAEFEIPDTQDCETIEGARSAGVAIRPGKPLIMQESQADARFPHRLGGPRA